MQPITPPRGPRRAAVTAHGDQEDLLRAMIEELIQYRNSQGVALELLAGLVRNHVLTCELVIIGPDGSYATQWHLPCAALAITPAKLTGPLTVAAGGATSNAAPTAGRGIAVYGVTGTPVNTTYGTRVFNIAAREIAIYGNVGDSFTLQAFTTPQAPQ